MASTYSTNLRLEVMAIGENSNTWGAKTSTNLNLIEQAVSGVASVAMTDADYTLTTSNAATDEARNAVITMTGTLTQARNVIVPSVDKVYIFKNSTTGGFGIVVKTSAGTGVTIPNGETAQLYCDATNVGLAETGGATTAILVGGGVGSLPVWTAATGSGAPVRATSPTLVAPVLGTPASGTLTNCTGLPAAGVTGLGTLATQSGTFSGTSSGTNTGDNATNSQYSGLVSNATHTGDVTGATSLTIANDVVTYAKMQNVSATDKLLGRSTAGSGDVEEIACTAAGRAILDDADATAQRATLGLVIGTNVQAYDADTAKTDVTQTFTAPQRGTTTTDNDGSFDLSATNNFKCTTAGALALTFTNIAAGQSGNILFINASNHAITAAANTKVASGTLAAISVTGTYLLGYFCDGTNVYVAATGAMS